VTSLFTSAESNKRADEAKDAASALLALTGDERDWGAVVLFYSAYHRVRATMLDDPIFTDATALSRISPKLTMEDRNATHHEGRRSDPEHRLGINEVVSLLYRGVNSHYMALHQASLQVRYGSGLVAPLDDLQRRCDLIHEAANNNSMR
jgi:hypothetical protein